MNVIQELEQEQIANSPTVARSRSSRPATPSASASRWSRAPASASRRSKACASRARTAASTPRSRYARSATARASSGSFPLYSPQITEIEVMRRGRVRRAKLYYLRGRTGKAARIAERRDERRAGGQALHGEAADDAEATTDARGGGTPRPPIADAGRRAGRAASEGARGLAMAKTLFDKIWDAHVVEQQDDGTCLLYIDRHLVHEVTSPQAFEGLRQTGRKVRRPDATLAVPDHNVPTTDRSQGIAEEQSRMQVETLQQNCREFGITLFDVDDIRQGIVHVIGPEQGFTLPGTTIVCGDSHTSTHGAFGALAFGIGTCEVEHVLATQTLLQKRPKNMRISGRRRAAARRHRQGRDPRDHRPDRHRGGTGHVDRVCRRSDPRPVDGRPHDGLQHVDRGRRARRADRAGRDDIPLSPGPADGAQGGRVRAGGRALAHAAHRRGRPVRQGGRARCGRRSSRRSPGARARRTSSRSRGTVPDPETARRAGAARGEERALDYMGLEPGTPMAEIAVDQVFIGSCTNARIEDLRAAAEVVRGRKVASSVHAMVVPGSGLVKHQAEEEGLDRIFLDAGFEWREAGCSMCLA